MTPRRAKGEGSIPDRLKTRGQRMTLTEFLTARIDEDEAAARRLLRYAQENELACRDPHMLGKPMPGWWQWPDVQAMCVRTLAECDAKRRIVEDLRPGSGDSRGVNLLHSLALEALATPYADHPDYDESWRP